MSKTFDALAGAIEPPSKPLNRDDLLLLDGCYVTVIFAVAYGIIFHSKVSLSGSHSLGLFPILEVFNTKYR